MSQHRRRTCLVAPIDARCGNNAINRVGREVAFANTVLGPVCEGDITLRTVSELPSWGPN